jgi:hypothetical protein
LDPAPCPRGGRQRGRPNYEGWKLVAVLVAAANVAVRIIIIMSMSDADSTCLDPAPRPRCGRQRGRSNYNNNILIPIVERIMPNGSEGMADRFKLQSTE